MSAIYDNWERLVSSVLRREHDRWLALCDSCSVSSISSDPDPDPDPRLSFSRLSQRFDSESDTDRLTTTLVMNFMGLSLDHRQWKEMLPPGKRKLLWTSAAPLSFSIDKRSGKNCFLLGASPGRGDIAMVVLKPTQMCEPIEMTESRFSHVVASRCPSVLNIRALLTTNILSPNTHYAAYLVFGLGQNNALMMMNPQEHIYLESSIYCSGRKVHEAVISQQGVKRKDGWTEIRLGRFYIDQQSGGQEPVVEVKLYEIGRIRTKDIYIEGLEFRPDTPTGLFFKRGR